MDRALACTGVGAGLGAGALGWACVGRWAGVRGALGWRAWGARQGRAAGVARGGDARQAGRSSGRRAGRQAHGRAGHARHGARGAAGALLGARSSRGTGAVRAAMHGLGVAWAPGLALGSALGALDPL